MNFKSFCSLPLLLSVPFRSYLTGALIFQYLISSSLSPSFFFSDPLSRLAGRRRDRRISHDNVEELGRSLKNSTNVLE